MRSEGQKAVNRGLVTKINGVKIDNIYHIYGSVSSETNSSELTTHIKIDLLKKRLDGVNCTCEDFKRRPSTDYLFMCSHLTATAYRFFHLTAKNSAKVSRKSEVTKENDSNKHETNNIVKLIRKVSKGPTYYEGHGEIDNEKIRIDSRDLRICLSGIKDKKTKFNYDGFEFEATIIEHNLPLNFTLKIRGKYFVLTTHKQFPVSLNDQNDVYLFNWKLYLPSKNQISKYIHICEKLKTKGEILYHKGIENHNKLITFLSSISSDIHISEEVKAFAAEFIKPEFYIYEIENNIYCDVKVNYGDDKINILKACKSKDTVIRNYKKEQKILLEVEKYSFKRKDESLIFTGGDTELFNILCKNDKSLYCLGNVIFGKSFKRRKIYDYRSTNAMLEEKDDFYEFSYGINNVDNVELDSLLSAFKLKKTCYKTKNNNFLDFEDQGVKNFLDLILILNTNEKVKTGLIQIDKNKALYLNEVIKNSNIGFIKGTEVLKNIEDILLNINKTDIGVPINLKATLREYQIDGFKWLKRLCS